MPLPDEPLQQNTASTTSLSVAPLSNILLLQHCSTLSLLSSSVPHLTRRLLLGSSPPAPSISRLLLPSKSRSDLYLLYASSGAPSLINSYRDYGNERGKRVDVYECSIVLREPSKRRFSRQS